jgi:Tfp pilus assembly protein PilF
VSAGIQEVPAVAYRRGDAEQAAVFGQAALSCARAAADRGATAQTLNVLGMLAARAGDAAAETYLRDSLAEACQLPELGAAVAALHTDMSDLLHADGQGEAAMAHLKEAARRFASVDGGDAPRPEIWTLVEW